MKLDMEGELFRVRNPDIGNGIFLKDGERIFAFVEESVTCSLAAILCIGLPLFLLDAFNDIIFEDNLTEHH